MTDTGLITQLLAKAQDHDQEAEQRLISLVYDELRAIAHQHLKREFGQLTLSTTALVNEAYVKLAAAGQPPFKGRAYFFAAAARAMRQVMVDMARNRKAQKRGSGIRPVDLDVEELAIDEQASELIALDDALTELSRVDERLSRVVECRFFGGMTEDQTSQVVGTTSRTVRRDWRKARAWLYHKLSPQDPRPPAAANS